MSGAELIAVLGITSSVVSIVDACSKILDRIEAFRKSLAFQDLVVQLPLLISVIEGLDTPKYRELLDDSTKQALARVLEGCLRQLRRLEKLIQSMTPAEAASKFEKTWKGIRSFGKDTKLREILGALNEYKSTITLHLSSVHVHKTQKPCTTSEAAKSYFEVPSSRLSHFVGRSEIFSHIQKVIDVTSIHPPVIVLTGAGGQGKTQVALEFCHRNEKAYQGVFWVNSSSETSATRSFEKILKTIGGEALSENGQDPKSTVRGILRDWKKPWLLVFDNYDDPNVFQTLSSFFPGSNGTVKSTILVTSRHVSSARLGTGIPLGGLSEDEGLELLCSRSRAISTCTPTAHDLLEGKMIVEKLGYLALAIDQAAAYISIRQLPFHIFIEHFERRKEFILKSTPQSLWEYRTRTSDDAKEGHQNLSVLTTWELSFDQISGSDSERKRIGEFLMQAAFFDPASIHEMLFSTFHDYNPNEPPIWRPAFETDGDVWDSFQFQDVVVELHNLSLVQGVDISSEGVCFSLHPLIKDWLQLRGQVQERQQRTSTAIAMTSSLLQSFETEKLALNVRQKLLAHIDCCVDNFGRYLTTEESVAKYGGFIEGFQTNFATFYGEHDRFNDAEKLFLKSLTIQVQSLGYQDIATLATLNNLGALYLDARQLDNAKAYLVQSLQVKESLLGPHHPRTLNSVNNIGNLLVMQQNFDEASQMYKRTLEGYTEINGSMHRTVLEALNNLGEVAMKKGDYEEAENIFKDAFTKARTLSSGKDDALVLYLASNLALVYKLQHRYHESVQIYSDVVVGREKLVGEKHSSTLLSMCEVADVYKALGDEALANEWYQRGKASQERRQRGEPLRKPISRPISEATTIGFDSDPMSRLSLTDTAESNAPTSDAIDDNGDIISGQGEQMDWEPEPITSVIDRAGRPKLNLKKRTIQPEPTQESNQVDRGGLVLYQFLHLAAAPKPTDNSNASDIDRGGLVKSNVGHASLPESYNLTIPEGQMAQMFSPDDSSIERVGLARRQISWKIAPGSQISGPLTSGNEIDRVGISHNQAVDRAIRTGQQIQAAQSSPTKWETFKDPQVAGTPQRSPVVASAASVPHEGLSRYGRLKRNHPTWDLGDEPSYPPQSSPPSTTVAPKTVATSQLAGSSIPFSTERAGQTLSNIARQWETSEEAGSGPSNPSVLSDSDTSHRVVQQANGWIDRTGWPSINIPMNADLLYNFYNPEVQLQADDYAPSQPTVNQPSSRVGLSMPNGMNLARAAPFDGPPSPNPQPSFPSVASASETSRRARTQYIDLTLLKDRGGWLQFQPSHIERRGGFGNGQGLPVNENESIPATARPRSNCEYIERGGVCMHNVFHQQ